MAKINTSSNVYTIVYAAVMVIIVAFLLAFVSSALKPIQDANVENDTKGQILTSLNVDIKTVNVAEAFNADVKDMIWNGSELVPYDGAFNSSYGALIKAGTLHVFVANTKDGVKYVLPVTGRGLWGGLWGYIALNEDKQTVYGTYFYHESETAGLGARIGERWFQEQFNGKPIFTEGSDEVALTVVKAGSSTSETEIDGVTGATLTSNGVAVMVHDGLSVYMSFIKGNAATCAGEEPACCQKAEGECCGKCQGEEPCEESVCPKEAEGECCGKCPKSDVE